MKDVLNALWPSVRKHMLLLITMCVLMVGGVSLSAVPPYFARQIVNIFTSQNPDIDKVHTLIVQLVGIYVAIQIIYRLFDFSIALFEAKVMRDLDRRSFAALQSQSMRFFEDSHSGSVAKYASRFRDAFESITDLCVYGICRDAVILIVITTIFIYSMPSFAFAFGIWTMFFVCFSIGAARYKFPYDTANAKEDSRVSGFLADSLGCERTIKSFACERSEQQRFNEAVESNYSTRIRSWIMSCCLIGIQSFLISAAEIGFICLMVRGWKNGSVTAGDFVFLQAYMVWILDHLFTLGGTIRKLMQAFANAKEMASIYKLKPEIQDSAGARPLKIREGRVEFQDVGFRYDEAEKGSFAIHDFNLVIQPGESVGIVGQTGAGKSTLLQLLLRFRDVSFGGIYIDSQDISDVTQESLRQLIATVPQNPELLHRTIKENIRIAKSDASDEEIEDAAKKAQAWEFIKKLPQRLDTIVGERGVKLSGGQCQRIAIARAILADPMILILDEATSALDSRTEHHVQTAIADLLKGRTSIVIAHRLSTLRTLNRIVVLKDGAIVQDGTHHELLKQKEGEYAQLWAHQTERLIAE